MVGDEDRIRAGLAMQMVAQAVGVPVEAMQADRTSGVRLGLKACRARWMAMYLAHVGHGWRLERVAHAFGVNRATASVGCRWVEDARDDRALDAVLERLADTLRDLCEAPRVEIAS